MTIGSILNAINKYAAVHVCMAAFFALCWFFHHLARLTLEICDQNADWREWASTNARMKNAASLVGWVAAHSSLAIAYVVMVIAAVAFAHVRGHAAWTYWLAALILCIPCSIYWWPCACILLNLLPDLQSLQP